MRSLAFSLALCLSFFASCTSTQMVVHTPPLQPDEEVVANVEGSAGGFMLFQFIPIAHNTRLERAYASAMAKAPGATRLTDITCQESWYWAWIGNGYTFRVRGTAVRPKREGAPQ